MSMRLKIRINGKLTNREGKRGRREGGMYGVERERERERGGGRGKMFEGNRFLRTTKNCFEQKKANSI